MCVLQESELDTVFTAIEELGSQLEEGRPHSCNKVQWCLWADIISEMAERWTPLTEVIKGVDTVQNSASPNEVMPKVSSLTWLCFFHCLT